MALNCIAMVDGVLRNCFVHNADVGLTDEELAEQLSRIWYRSFSRGILTCDAPNIDHLN